MDSEYRKFVSSPRPFNASRIFIGKKPDEVIAIVPRLFSICGDAQTAAAAKALTAGADICKTINAIDVMFETVQE
jgi:coenzyme F420-reducing hydrogenase alpha subunit